MVLLDYKEHTTLLAALRHFQATVPEVYRKKSFPVYFSDVDPMTDEEIDDLCQAINV